MVRAILDGRKTVTRRVIKPQPELKGLLWTLGDAKWSDGVESFCPMIGHSLYNRMPYKPDNVLWVRETWQWVYDIDERTDQCIDETGRYVYCADDPMPFSHWLDSESGEHIDCMPWKPSIHMPKEAARLFLRVTGVRVERLQDITDVEAVKEGMTEKQKSVLGKEEYWYWFKELWNSTIKSADLPLYGWAANPWVWVIKFERCEKP